MSVHSHMHAETHTDVIYIYTQVHGLPRWLSGKETAGDRADVGSIPGPWRGKWQPTTTTQIHTYGHIYIYINVIV